MSRRIPFQREWTCLGMTNCWLHRRSPLQCCFEQPPLDCWDGEYRTFQSCCGTLPHLGAGIKRCTSVRAAVTSSVCEHDEYLPSALEAGFAANADALISNTTEMCARLNHRVRSAWLRQIRGCEEFSKQVFSTLCKRGQVPQLIEPLAGLLRDPRMVCEGRGYVFFADWLLFADSSIVSKVGRKIFFDAGGSQFRDALQFFLAEYAAHDVHFDEIYVWEAKRQGQEAYWDGTPHEVRQAFQPRLSLFDGIPVTAEKGDAHNPVSRIGEICREEDFCVFKLDIDRPTLERSLVSQLLESTRRRGPLVDEFFFEHHVRGPMERFGWRGTWYAAGEKPDETFADSYALFISLRMLGIRAHSWV